MLRHTERTFGKRFSVISPCKTEASQCVYNVRGWALWKWPHRRKFNGRVCSFSQTQFGYSVVTYV